MSKIIVYATAEKGHGHVMPIGEYDSIDEIKLRLEMFKDDIVITFEEIEEQ